MLKECRLCGYPRMTQFLDLGFTPPADQFIKQEKLNAPETYYPLKVVCCDKCMFVQLNYVVPAEILFQNDYPYESSTTKTGRQHFDDFAKSVVDYYNLKKGDFVIDIGSNVGVLLKGFKNRRCKVLGIDPAKNIVHIAEKNGIPTISEFFNSELAKKIAEKYGRAKIITATNLFAHVDDLHDLMKGIDNLIDEDGIFIIEAPYLVHLLSNLEYDTIYHEHLSYLSLKPLIKFFHCYDFELFDVTQVDIHGGSNRMFVCRSGKITITNKVLELLKYEEDNNVHSLDTLTDFAQKVEQNKQELVSLLRTLKSKGEKIAGVSAPAKGMTLLNYCKIGSELIEFITEKTLLKIGKYAPGSHLPIKPDSALVTENIDYALLLAWNFKDEIINNLSEFRNRGGKFIIPIPRPEIVD